MVYSFNGMAGRPNRTPNKMTPEARGRFLLALARTGEWKASAASIGVTYGAVWRHKQRDPEFAEACEMALGRLFEEAMTTVRLLAIDGVEEAIFNKHGEQIGTRRKYDTRVLLRLLARLAPEEWGDRVRVDQTIAGRVEHEHSGAIRVEDLTVDQRRLVRRLLTAPENN